MSDRADTEKYNKGKLFATSALIAFGCVTGAALDYTWDKEQKLRQQIDRIAQLDVTKVACADSQNPPSLVHTLSPLLFMQDQMTQKTGNDLLKHAQGQKLTFAFCPLAEGTASFESMLDEKGKPLSVLKLNTAASDKEQQAAVLQFLKEYQAKRVTYQYNQVVHADALLQRQMPGRLAPETDPKGANLQRFERGYSIPAR